MIATLSYSAATNTVTVTDTTGEAIGMYRLVQLVDGARKLLTPVFLGDGATWVPGGDGAYRLALQLVAPSMIVGVLEVVAESEPVCHLQLLSSLSREQAAYTAAVASCHLSFKYVLQERYLRQKAVLAYSSCNLLLADKLLRNPPACC